MLLAGRVVRGSVERSCFRYYSLHYCTTAHCSLLTPHRAYSSSIFLVPCPSNGKESEQKSGILDFDQSDIGKIGGGIATEKIKNAVPSRIQSGGKTGPGHRRLRRIGSTQGRQGPPVWDSF